MVIVNALGDALSARAQLMSNIDRLSGLQQAIAEGYSIALAVDRNQPDALVGCAEVEYQIGLCECFLPTWHLRCADLQGSMHARWQDTLQPAGVLGS